MEIVATQTELKDVLAKVLSSVPEGFVFDEIYIIDHLSAEYPDEYLAFLNHYYDREKPTEMAAEAICSAIEKFEGVLVEEQKLKVLFPTLHSSMTKHKVWKKI